MTCSGCGFDAPADFAFCPKCGRKLEREPEADRRTVSVLFADLSGFTALAERLDPEDVRAFQTDLFQEMAAAIQQYDGFVEKYVGDAVMAVFGAPVAHEDDPERALRAALAMQERMAGLNRRWERRLGKALALHVGVNTGPVVARPGPGQRGNLAARPARLRLRAGGRPPSEGEVRACHRLPAGGPVDRPARGPRPGSPRPRRPSGRARG
ncbi:MAG: hypothetical protein HYY53_03020 [candidate division NC10 bacterium]|nr:hypothetical protein [candidate division NC10 bacterium]